MALDLDTEACLFPDFPDRALQPRFARVHFTLG